MRSFQVGVLVPWVNTAMEEELPFLVDSSIGFHWSRLRPETLPINGHDPSYLKPMLDAMPRAMSAFDGLRLDAIVLGCTSAEARYELSAAHTNDCEYFTALRSLVYVMKFFGAHRIMLVAPYDPITMAAERASLRREGLDVIKEVTLSYRDEIRHIPTSDIVHSVRSEFSSECDCVLLSCTALYTIEAVAALSAILPSSCLITSSNLAIAARLHAACTAKQTKQGTK